MSKTGRNDPCPCGSGKKHKHCCLLKDDAPSAAPATRMDIAATLQAAVRHHEVGRLAEAEPLYRQILQAQPEHPDALHLLGLIAHQVGQHDAAVELMHAALRVNPNYAAARGNLGNALKALGRLDEAVACYREALRLDPHFIEAHQNLGLALKAQGRLADAAASFRAMLELNATHPEAHFNLGVVLHQQGRLAEAADCYARAVALNPTYAQAHNNLGAAHKDSGRVAAAVQSYRAAIALQPDYADAHHNLGVALVDSGQPYEALEAYAKAMELDPRNAEVYSNFGMALQETGDLESARRCYAKACELGDVGALVRSALMLPPIMGTREEIAASRATFEANVDTLIAEGIKLEDPLRHVGTTNFYLAYHGLDDKPLQEKVARFYEQACPSLLFEAPHCAGRRRPGPLRVAFLSKFIYDHSVSRCLGKVVCDLSERDGFEVSLLSTTQVSDAEFAKTYAGFEGRRVHLPFDLKKSRELIAALELDCLMFMDVGMEPHGYFLAYARLARMQCVMGGHPVTTGIANMDWFLSVDGMEPPGAEAHYSEKLLRSPRGMSYFERPALPPTLKTRAELGLPQDGHLYICPMKLQKIHPDLDEAIARILRLDTEAHVVFFEDNRHPSRGRQLAQRLDRTVPADVRGRVLFHPWITDYGDFISTNAAADVVLDSIHFGCGSTLIATFAVGTPIVTLAGGFLRGMGGAGFCRMLGADECVVTDLDAYAQRAVQLASDRALRQRVRDKLLDGGELFYGNRQPLQDMVDFLHAQLPR